MDNEDRHENISPGISHQSPTNNLLTDLLQEPLPNCNDHFDQIVPGLPPKSEPPDQDNESPQPFDLRAIQKQDFQRVFPEKPYQERPEDDPLKMTIPTKATLVGIPSPMKYPSASTRAAYHAEQRADKLARYREKKRRRVWQRKISYECRKVVADKRERLNGRFMKKGASTCEKNDNQLIKLEDYYD